MWAGGLNWEVVSSLIERVLSQEQIEIEVYLSTVSRHEGGSSGTAQRLETNNDTPALLGDNDQLE